MKPSVRFRKFNNGVLVKRNNSRVFVYKTGTNITLHTKILVPKREVGGYEADPRFKVKRRIAQTAIKFNEDSFRAVMEAYALILRAEIELEG